MPRGQKTCPKCKALNGPRAYFCKSCQEPFVIKGKKATPLMKAASDTNDYMEHFNEIDYTEDPSNLRFYDGKARCWISQCGQFRIRQYDTFMGINVGHNRRTTLEKRVAEPTACGPEWDMVSRHVALKSAARRYVRIKRQMAIRETKAEKKERQFKQRVASHRKRKK